MLNRVSNDVDKREGSVIYDALAPAAYFLADQYFQLSNFVDLCFPGHSGRSIWTVPLADMEE